MSEKQEEIKNQKKMNEKPMTEFELKDLEKTVENYMKFKVAKNQKTSLIDPLDILTKEPTLIPIEKQIEKYKIKSENINAIKKTKKYESGFEIKYTLDKYNQMEIISLNESSIDENILHNLESSLDSNLELYIRKLFSKFNYSPIIKKVFGKKITFAELEELSILWRFFVEMKIKSDEKLILDFRKKLIKTMTENIQLLIRHIFSIMKVREAIYTIGNIFQKHYFVLLKEGEKKEKELAYNMRVTYLDPVKETSGNGVSFILVKEFKRALNMLLYSSKFLFYSFASVFNNNFEFLYQILRKMFFVFFNDNSLFSTLLFNIKAIFLRSDVKDICDDIDKLTIPFELDFKNGVIKTDIKKEIYKEVNDVQFENSEDLLFDNKQCFDQLGYSVDKNDEKGEEIVVETEEEKKVKEIKDIQELVNYIEGDTSTKKKKKKKKKKENPINILLKLREENKNIDDDTISQSSLSYVSQDSVINNFKRDLKRETYDNIYEKIKPNFSENFLSNFK